MSPQGFLAFDLKDILAALGTDGLKAVWTVHDVTPSVEGLIATGGGAPTLERLAASEDWLPGHQLAEIAQSVQQVIWGEFKGYVGTSFEAPWVIVTAVDSSWWEVRSVDASIIAHVASVFKNVEWF